MNACEYFTSVNSRFHSNKVKITIPASFMSSLETLILSLLISSINFNALFASTEILFTFRTFLIFFAFLVELINKFLIKSNAQNPSQSFILRFFSIFLFFTSFIYSAKSFKFYFKGSCILFSKLFFHSNIIFSLLNSAGLAAYLTFYSYFVSTVPLYTQASGLIFYLQSKFPSVLTDSLKISFFTGKYISMAILLYIACIHTLLRSIFVLLRISPFYNSIWDFLIFISIACVTNGIYYFVFRFIDAFILYNTSFICDESPDDSLDLKYYKIIVAYKSKEIKFKSNSKAIKIIEEYIDSQILDLKQLIGYVELAKKNLDASTFIHVPQPNKNYPQKLRDSNLVDTIKNRFKFAVEKWLFTERFNILIDHFASILLICKNIKESENIIVLPTKNQIEIIDMIRNAKALSIQLEMKLKLDAIDEIINKLF
jgi:hypothetical protein